MLFDGFKHSNMGYFLWPLKSHFQITNQIHEIGTLQQLDILVGVSKPIILFYSYSIFKFRSRIIVNQVIIRNHKYISKDGKECVKKVT